MRPGAALAVLFVAWLLLIAAASRAIPIVSLIAGSATIKASSGLSHELSSVEPLQSGAQIATALDSLAAVNLDQVGTVRLGSQTTSAAAFADGILSFQMTAGSLCVVAQSQNVSVNTGGLHLAIASPSTIYDVLTKADGVKIAVFRGGLVVGGPHLATTTLYAGSAATVAVDGKLSNVPISTILSDFSTLKCPNADVIGQAQGSPTPSAGSGGNHVGAIIGTVLALGAIAAAVGHGGGGSSSQGSPTPTPPGPIVLTPSSLAFSNVGPTSSKSFAASETGYAGGFTLNQSACSGIANVTPLTGTAAQAFTVTAVGPGGPCNLVVSDDHGQSANVSVTVGPFGAIVLTPSSLSFSNVGPTSGKPFAVSETGYAGGFTVDEAACNGIANTNPLSGTAAQVFTVTAVGPGGPCNLVVSDDHGQSANQSVTVGPFGPVISSPGSLNLSVGGSSKPVTVSESGYSGTFSVSAGGCSGIASIAPSVGTNFTVSPTAVGNCRIAFDDDHGQSGSSLAFVAAGTISANPQTVQLSGPGDTKQILVSELSPANFLAASSNLAVATVTLIANTPTAATFQITGVSNGRATINVSDTLGSAAAVSVGVGTAPLFRRHGANPPPPGQAPRGARPQPPVSHPQAPPTPQGIQRPAQPQLPVSHPQQPLTPPRVQPGQPVRGPLLTNATSLTFQQANTSQSITVQERGYDGPLLVASSNPKVLDAVVQGNGTTRFVVLTARGPGTAVLRISDAAGGQVTVRVTVLPEQPIRGAHQSGFKPPL